MNTKTWNIQSVDLLSGVAKEVISVLEEQVKREDGGAASVLALHGDLGAGKTTFMQALAKELGVSEQVTSPTFVIMKKYETDHSVFKHLTHLDAYRIEDIDEMRPLQFEAELAEKDTIIGIEWAEKIEALLPAHTLTLTFTIEGDTRKIVLHGKEK